MSGIRAANTQPEMVIRHGLHAKGFRYRLHCSDIPGKPDLTFARWRAVIFVHGCFWHGHNCHLFKIPSTRTEFWTAKIGRNRARDALVQRQIEAEGWRRMTVWECATRGRTRLPKDALIVRIAGWLTSNEEAAEIAGLP